MGIVSSVARQVNPYSPFLYIQTDTSINPGDSGGPLVNTAGEIVGLDTFILSDSGGSEGLGFAIPGSFLELVARQLQKYGHMHRQVIGVGVQTITPTLAGGLKLPRASGVIVSDLAPGGPGESAGLKLNDIILSIDGDPVENLPMFAGRMLLHPGGEPVKVQVLRGAATLDFNVQAVIEEPANPNRLKELIEGDALIAKLGVLGVSVNEQTQSLLPNLRGRYGVLVAARSADAAGASTELQPGDVIHEVNGAAVSTVQALREMLDGFHPGDPVALFIEREGKLLYVSYETE